MKKLLLVLLTVLLLAGCSSKEVEKEEPPHTLLTTTGVVTPDITRCEFCGKELTDGGITITKDMGSWTAAYHVCPDCYFEDMAFTSASSTIVCECKECGNEIDVCNVETETTEESGDGWGYIHTTYWCENCQKFVDIKGSGWIGEIAEVEEEAEPQTTELRPGKHKSEETTDTSSPELDEPEQTGLLPGNEYKEEETTSNDTASAPVTFTTASYSRWEYYTPESVRYSFLIGRNYSMDRGDKFVSGVVKATAVYKKGLHAYYEAYYMEFSGYSQNDGWFYFDGDLRFKNRVSETDLLNIDYGEVEEEEEVVPVETGTDTLDPTKPLNVKTEAPSEDAEVTEPETVTINYDLICDTCGNKINDVTKNISYVSSNLDDDTYLTVTVFYWCDTCNDYMQCHSELPFKTSYAR